jgi:hypothetical protein
MGARRTQQPPVQAKPRYSDAEIAAAIVIVAAGYYAVTSIKEAIKGMLLEAVIPDMDEAADVAADYMLRDEAKAKAKTKEGEGAGEDNKGAGAQDVPEGGGSGRGDDGDVGVSQEGGGSPGGTIGDVSGSSGGVRGANLVYRAHYVINAARRIAKDIRAGKQLGEAVLAEEPKFRAHLEANRQRLSGNNAQMAMAQAYGTTRFKWRHSGAQDFRPSHKAADGKVYDVTQPPTSTGALPGVLIHCGCFGEPMPPDAQVTLV